MILDFKDPDQSQNAIH